MPQYCVFNFNSHNIRRHNDPGRRRRNFAGTLPKRLNFMQQPKPNPPASTARYRHDGPSRSPRRPPALTTVAARPVAATTAAPNAAEQTQASPAIAPATKSAAHAPAVGRPPKPKQPSVAAHVVSSPIAVPRPLSPLPFASSNGSSEVATTPTVRRALVELPPVVLRLPEIQANNEPSTRTLRLGGWAGDERMLMAAIALGMVLLTLLFFASRSTTSDPAVPLPGDSEAPTWQPDCATATNAPPAPMWKEPIVVTPPIADAPSVPPQSTGATNAPPLAPALDETYPTDPPRYDAGQQVGDRYREHRTADVRNRSSSAAGDFQRSDLPTTGPAVRLDGTIEKHLPGMSYDRP